MKKTAKYILITVVVLLALVGGIVVLYFTDPARQPVEEESSEYAEAVYIIDDEEENIESVEISGPNGDYTIVQNEIELELEETDDEEEEAEPVYELLYSYEGYENYTINYEELDSSTRGLVYLRSSREIGPADEIEDLADFGLDKDSATTMTVNFDDGNVVELNVGVASSGTIGRYVEVDGVVHIANINDMFFEDFIDLVLPYSYVSTPTVETYSIIEYLKLSGTGFDEPIELYYDAPTYKYMMSTPLATEAGITVMDTLTGALESFTSGEVVKIDVTEEDIEDYGLNEPFATMEYSVNGDEHTLSVSEQYGTDRYLIADNNTTIIYRVKASDVEIWAEATVEDLRSTTVYLPAIMNCDDFNIKTSDVDLKVDMSRAVNEDTSTDAQVIYKYSGTVDGKEIEYDNITGLYMAIISIASFSYEPLEHEEEPTVTFTFNYYDDFQNGGTDVLEYFDAGEDRYVAYINGEYTSTVRASSIEDKFLTSLDTFLTQVEETE